MKLLVLVALTLAVALASKHPRYEYNWEEENSPQYGIDSNKFEAGKEYQYMYNGQLMTGIPQSSEQHSATRIQAVVSIVFHKHDQLAMQLRHVRFASLNDKVSEPRRLQPFGLFEPIDIVAEHLETLRLPVESKYRHGMIKELVFDGADAPWSVNIKRGVLNMIQVNLRKERRTDLTSEMEKETIHPMDMFTTQEETIEGDCETVYSVESLPVQYRREVDDDINVLNVTKSIDFDKCQVRPRINYNWRVADICPTCEGRYNKEDKTVRSSTVIRQSMLVTDKRDACLIEKVVVESQYTIVPFKSDGNVMQTYINMTLELIKSSDRVNTIPKIESPIESDSGLMTTLDLDVLKEEFNMNGKQEFLDELPYGFGDNKALVRHCLERMVLETRDVSKDAPRYFSRLVTTLRMLTADEIEQVHDKFMKNTPFSAKDTSIIRPLLVDAMAIAGTLPAMEHIVEKITNHQVTPIRAAFLLRKMSAPRVVSREMLDVIERLTTEETCEHSRTIWQSAQLAYGSLINIACKENGWDKTALQYKRQVAPGYTSPVCSRELKQELVDKLFGKLEECKSTFCKVVVLKSIANAGLDLALEPLSKIIVSVEYSPLIRVEAVLATRQLVDIMPRRVQQVLLPVYMAKRTTPPQVRIAAIHQLLKTQPEKALIDQLTHSLLTEENKQVAAYTFTSMNSLANSTNPCEKKFAQDLTLSLRHARFIEESIFMGYSKHARVQAFCPIMNRGLNIDMSSVMTNYSRVPQVLAASLDLTHHNLWMKEVISVGVTQQNIDKAYRYVMRNLYHDVNTPIDELFDSSEEETRDVNPKFANSLEKIFEDLSIEERSYNGISKEGIPDTLLNFYLRMGNQDQWILPVDYTAFTKEFRDSFESQSEMSIHKIISRLSKMEKEMSLPYNMQAATFAHQLSRKIPTTLGLPLQLTLNMPVVLQLQGIVKVNLNEKTPLRKMNVELKAKTSMTATKMIKIESWSPIVNSALKVITTVHVNAPIDAKITVDLLKQEPQVKIAFKPSTAAFDLVRVQSRPITSVLVWPAQLQQWKEAEERTILGGEWTRQTPLNMKFGERSLGMEIVTRGFVHTTPAMKVTTTPFCEFAGPNKFAITVRPGVEMPKTYEMIVSGKLFERLSKQKMGRKMNDFFTESDEYLQSSEEKEYSSEAYEGENPTQHQLRVLLKTVGSSIKREAVVEGSVKCGDQKKACTYKLAIRRTPVPRSEEQEEWKLDSELSILYPETPKSFEEIAQRKYMCRLNAKWGKDKFVDVKLVGEQSELMETLIERSLYRRSSLKHSKSYRSLYSPVSQHDQLVRFSLLDQYKVDLDYSVSPIVRNVTEKALRLVENIYYWQTEVNTQLPKEMRSKNQIRARLNIDPINRQYINVTIQTPNERVIFKDIALPMPLKGVNIRTSSLGGRQESGICQLRSGRVQTFDGVKYSSPIPSCWTLLTKDCQHRSKFAVFVKETEGELKEIKIVTQHVKLIVRALPELECDLNGDKVDCGQIEEVFVHGRHLALRVTKGEYLKVELPEAGIRVYFDGLSVNVKTSESLFAGSLCGLCGQFDREERCELQTARKECLSVNIPRDVRRFVQSYMPEACDISEVEGHYTHEPPSWEQESYRHIYGDEEESPLTFGWDKEDKKMISPSPKTLVMEQSGEICVSKSPVPRCPRHSRAIEHAPEVEPVVYSCVNRNSIEAERLLREVRESRVIRRASEMEASYQTTVNLPTKCIRL